MREDACFHLSREYSVDPLEILFVRDVMQTDIVALPEDLPRSDHAAFLLEAEARWGQKLYPIVAPDGTVKAVTTRRMLADFLEHRIGANPSPVLAYPDESLREVVYRMAETSRTSLPVIDNATGRKLAGIVSLEDLLQARVRHLEEEQRRERVLRVRLPFSASDDVAGGGDAGAPAMPAAG